MTGKGSDRIRLGLRIAGPLLLAGLASVPAWAAGNGGTPGYNDTRDGRQLQPEQQQVIQREKHAGIAYSPIQREQQINQINRELANEDPTVRKTFAQNPVPNQNSATK